MRLLLRGFIRCYWLVWPRHLNRGCVYRETCSHHVHRIAGESGFVAGCQALLLRYRTCRPGYSASTSPDGELGIILCDGSFLPQPLIAEDILAPIQATIQSLEQHFSKSDEAPNHALQRL